MPSTSSANPYRLRDYSTVGLALVEALRAEATAVTDSLDALCGSGSGHVPSLGDAGGHLVDLVGDWQHLDQFVGDVAAGFFAVAAAPAVFPGMPGPVTVATAELGRAGMIGFANRDEAVAQARSLAGDLRAALGDHDDLSADAMEALAGRAARGQYDPAFAVTLLETLGVEDYIAVTRLIGEAWPGEYDPDEGFSHDDWPLEVVAPFATVLTTAMDTRSGPAQGHRIDGDHDALAAGDRLDDDWVATFIDPGIAGVGYSVLVEQADLPADVLVGIGNAHLSDHLADNRIDHNPNLATVPWEWLGHANAEVNLLQAIAADEDAALSWLHGTADGQAATNAELLLRYDTGRYPNPVMGEALGAVLDSALGHSSPGAGDVFDTTMSVIADQGEAHFDELLPILGEGARTHIDRLANITMMVTMGAGEGSLADPLFEAHDFLQVVMADDTAAQSVYIGAVEYLDEQLQADLGDSFTNEAIRTGGLMGLVTEADENAAEDASRERLAARQSSIQGFNLVKEAIGFVPGGGLAVNSSASVATHLLNHVGVAGTDTDINQAYDDIAEVRLRVEGQLTATLATYEYTMRPEWHANDIAAEHGGDFFVDGSSPRRAIKPVDEMTDEELVAYNSWLNSDQVGDAIGDDRTNAGSQMRSVIENLEER